MCCRSSWPFLVLIISEFFHNQHIIKFGPRDLLFAGQWSLLGSYRAIALIRTLPCVSEESNLVCIHSQSNSALTAYAAFIRPPEEANATWLGAVKTAEGFMYSYHPLSRSLILWCRWFGQHWSELMTSTSLAPTTNRREVSLLRIISFFLMSFEHVAVINGCLRFFTTMSGNLWFPKCFYPRPVYDPRRAYPWTAQLAPTPSREACPPLIAFIFRYSQVHQTQPASGWCLQGDGGNRWTTSGCYSQTGA